MSVESFSAISANPCRVAALFIRTAGVPKGETEVGAIEVVDASSTYPNCSIQGEKVSIADLRLLFGEALTVLICVPLLATTNQIKELPPGRSGRPEAGTNPLIGGTEDCHYNAPTISVYLIRIHHDEVPLPCVKLLREGLPMGLPKGPDKGKSWGKGVPPPPVFAPAANPPPPGPP